MSGDVEKLQLPYGARPLGEAGGPLSQPEHQRRLSEAEDERPIAFISPPPLISRVFPGL